MAFPHFNIEELERLLSQPGGRPDIVRARLEWFLHFAQHGSVSSTCRRFGIARTTFYRWVYRFDPQDLSTLEDHPLHFSIPGHPGEERAALPLSPQPPAALEQDPAGSLQADRPISLPRQNHRPLILASILLNLVLIALLAILSAEWRRSSDLHASLHSTEDSAGTASPAPQP